MDADSLYLHLSAAVRAAEDKMGVWFVGVSFLTFCPICGFRPKISKSASASLEGYLKWVLQNFGVASFVPCDLLSSGLGGGLCSTPFAASVGRNTKLVKYWRSLRETFCISADSGYLRS